MTMTPTTTDWQPTACILCECNCGIEVQLEGRTLSRIRGDKAHPGSQGYTCNKAMRLDHYQNGRHRLTSPMRRRPDGTFEEIDWDTAIAEVAAGFERIRDEHGGESIFYYGGGGQGNHLGGGYGGAFLKALGSRYRSGALAQEKTGEAWVDAQLTGGHTRGEFEHAEVAVFVGKNPWMSQSFPRARLVLREIAKDPKRSMIVIDPVRDRHRQAGGLPSARPAGERRLVPGRARRHARAGGPARRHLHRRARDGVGAHDRRARGGSDRRLRAALRRRRVADPRGRASHRAAQTASRCSRTSASSRARTAPCAPTSTSSFGSSPATSRSRAASTCTPGWFRCCAAGQVGRTPVTGAPVIGGLTPCNVIPDEILTDHPDRFRAMIVESSNPAHSLADSQRFREAFEALELRARRRRGDDRDGAAGGLRAARRQPVREARGDLLQSRVPAQHVPPAPPAAGSAPRHAARARDLGAADPRAGHRRRGPAATAACRRGARAARPTRRR